MKYGDRVEKKSTKAHYKIVEHTSNGKILLQRLVIGSKSDNTLIVDDLNSFKAIRPIEGTILYFDDDYDFLSNLFEEPILHNGVSYPSAEHAFQALKTNDEEQKNKILQVNSPSKVKVLGKKLPLKENWENIKDEEMYNICLSKFKNNAILKEKLLNTGNLKLVNGNTGGDDYWGAVIDKNDIIGTNKLGTILMKVREELKNS